MYFPDVNWPSVMIEGAFEGDITKFRHGEDVCIPRQDQLMAIPDFEQCQILRETDVRFQSNVSVNVGQFTISI